MGINLTPAHIAATVSTGVGNALPKPKCVRKQRYTTADLPFPRGGRHIQIWRKVFVPTLLAWAGSQEDPFGTNGQMGGEIEKIWKQIYPTITLDETNYEALQNVVSAESNRLSEDSNIFVVRKRTQ
jgi:hypothetical protein